MEQFIKKYNRLLYKCIHKYPNTDHKELYQVAVLALLELRETFDESRACSFVSYAEKTITYKLLDYIKMQPTIQYVDLDEAIDTFDYIEAIALKANAKDVIKEFKKTLDDRNSDIFINHLLYDNMTLKDLALEYGISIGRVKQIEDLIISRLRTFTIED